jgi:hypothetical protein
VFEEWALNACVWVENSGRKEKVVKFMVYTMWVCFVLCLQPLVPGVDVFWVYHNSSGIFSTIWSYNKESMMAWWNHLNYNDYTWWACTTMHYIISNSTELSSAISWWR